LLGVCSECKLVKRKLQDVTSATQVPAKIALLCRIGRNVRLK
jgi:hypothetical protein